MRKKLISMLQEQHYDPEVAQLMAANCISVLLRLGKGIHIFNSGVVKFVIEIIREESIGENTNEKSGIRASER